MMNFLRILLAGCLLLAALPAEAKKALDERKMARKAETHFQFSEYDEALPMFLKLLEKNPDNARYCFYTGICYYYSSTARPLAVPYFERALRLPGIDKTADLYLHAGLAYLSVNRFGDASTCFHLFRQKADAAYDPTVADRLIKYCENGLKFWAKPARARIRNLGKNVNSKYPDYAPVFTKDESQLLFTSKRPGTTGGRRDENGYFYEDIYLSRNLASRKWGESGRYDTSYKAPKFGPFRFFFARAENVSEINTNDHDGSIAMSPEGENLFIYRYGDIWKAAWGGSRWEKPEKLHQEVDARSSVEPSLCFSPDGNTLYFVSDRKGGMGGKDIWMCRKNGNSWSLPENLGPKINTAQNEDAPNLTKDGNTLYFSSEGHNSMGGFDVFRSDMAADGSWDAPENLGAPINNGGDDIFYTPGQDGNFAYYATLNRYDEGDLDLYSVMYYPEVKPMAKLRLAKDELPAGASVQLVVDNGNGPKTYDVAAGDSVMYEFTPGGTAMITVKADGYRPFADTIVLSGTEYEYALQEISVGTKDDDRLALQLSSYFFDIDYAVDADTLLDQLADRKQARTLFLGGLTDMRSVYTAYSTQADRVTLVSAGSTIDPLAATALASGGSWLTLDNGQVLFDVNEAFVRNDMKAQLDRMANMLKKDPSATLRITGHADSQGGDDYNLKLSKRRATAVRNYFIISGISPSRLVVQGEGENVPVAPNDNPQGRSMNRRVEIQLVR